MVNDPSNLTAHKAIEKRYNASEIKSILEENPDQITKQQGKYAENILHLAVRNAQTQKEAKEMIETIITADIQSEQLAQALETKNTKNQTPSQLALRHFGYASPLVRILQPKTTIFRGR